jgi:hypothetical protein
MSSQIMGTMWGNIEVLDMSGWKVLSRTMRSGDRYEDPEV